MSTMETVRGPEIHVRPTAPTYTSAMTIRGKVSDAGLADELELNTRYFSSVPGILKLVQIVIAILAFCCISPPLAWFARLFTFIQSISFALTLLLCFAYLVTLQRALWPQFDWLLAELVFTSLASVSLFLSSILQIAYTSREDYRYRLSLESSILGTSYFGAYIAAGICGLFNSIAYTAGAYFLYRDWKHPERAVRPEDNVLNY